MSKITHYKILYKSLSKSLNKIKSKLLQLCKDKSISLEERWLTYTYYNFGEVYSYIYEFSNPILDKYFRKSSYFNAPECYGRKAEINLIKFLEDDVSFNINISIEILNEAKEELIRKNIRACKLDW